MNQGQEPKVRQQEQQHDFLCIGQFLLPTFGVDQYFRPQSSVTLLSLTFLRTLFNLTFLRTRNLFTDTFEFDLFTDTFEFDLLRTLFN